MASRPKQKKILGIYLVGFSGSGKSAIAKKLGARLGLPTLDLDDFIVERSGMTIPAIFQKEGEPGFRIREAEALRAASDNGRFVVATGGGTLVRQENRNYMSGKGWIICLDARPHTILARITRQLSKGDPNAIRPMLDAVYPLERIKALKHGRVGTYLLADWTIHTDRLTEEQVTDEIVRAIDILENSNEPENDLDEAGEATVRHSLNPDLPPPVIVSAGPWPYQVVIGWDHLDKLGENIRAILPQARRAAVLADPETWSRIGSVLTRSLNEVHLDVHLREVAEDESAKNFETLKDIQDWMLGIPLRRDDVVVIVGGGVVDDIGGFAASTYMRGVPLVKVPASLEAMVDISIGGKTALNHPRARNLVGTFYHPRLVWSDAALLQSEPSRQLRASWAEIVKYAMSETSLLQGHPQGTTLFEELRQNLPRMLALEKRTVLSIIARCVALKAHVIEGDERDLGHYRILLNYGHTIGHALEAATNYALIHGEAVAVGMTVEANLAVMLGLAKPEVAAAQTDMLERFGLPTRLPDVSLDLLLERIQSDKKVVGDAPRWVLPISIGQVKVTSAVTEKDLRAALVQSK